MVKVFGSIADNYNGINKSDKIYGLGNLKFPQTVMEK